MKLKEKSLLRNKFCLGNQSGQAMVENMLILIISVTLLFLAKGVFSGLNNFMTSYVGGYFKCLMVQGELPALGATSDLTKHTSAGYKCSASYNQNANTAGNGNSTGTSGGTKNIGTAKPITKTKGSTKETASSRGSSSSIASKKSSKDENANRSRFNNRGGGDDDDNSFSSNITNRSDAYSTADNSADDEMRTVSLSRNPRADEKPEKYRAVTGKLEEDIKKNARGGGFKIIGSKTKNISTSLDDRSPGPRKFKLSPPVRTMASASEEVDEPLTFGSFLKWLIIAGIIIALFVLLGGQVLNYSNSDSD